MNERAEEYRTRLEELRKRGGGRWRTPSSLRDEITAWASRLRSEGQSTGAIAQAIQLSESTLGKWLASGEGNGHLCRVRVEDDRLPGGGGGLVVVTPGGFRLEGLSVDEAINVLRRL